MKRLLLTFALAALPQMLHAQSLLDSLFQQAPIQNRSGPERVYRSQLTTQEVIRLQRALSTLGYYRGRFDGNADPATWESVATWARERGWTPPTTLRSAHLAAMEAEMVQRGTNSGHQSATGSAAADQTVQRVQRALTQLGYYSGLIDGQSNHTTISALAHWARDRGWNAPSAIREAHARHMEEEVERRLLTQAPAAVTQPASAPAWVPDKEDTAASQTCVGVQYERSCIRLTCDAERGTILDLSAFQTSGMANPIQMSLSINDNPISFQFDPIENGPALEGRENAGLLAGLSAGRTLTIKAEKKIAAFDLAGFPIEYARVGRECNILVSRLRNGENPYPGRVQRLANETATPAAHSNQWKKLKDTDIAEKDVRHGLADRLLRRIPEDQCTRLCQETDLCRAYTYNPNGGTCFLKPQAERFTAHPGATSGLLDGRKPGFAPPPTDGPGPVVDGSVRWRETDTIPVYQARIKQAARHLGGVCDVEEATLAAVAKGLTWNVSPTNAGRVGNRITVDWTGNTLSKRIPLWLVVHSRQPLRFSGKGHVALGPAASNPFGILTGGGETRAVVSMATRGAGVTGSIAATPLIAGPLDLSVTLVGYLRGCDKEIVLNRSSYRLDVRPAQAEIVLNTAEGRANFSHVIDIPAFSRRILLNETRFLMVDAESGAEIVERGGSQLQISPTHRFVAVNQNGRTDIVDTIDGRTAATIGSGAMRWGLGDSVVFTTNIPWGKVNLSSTFGNFLAVDDQMTGPSCCDAERGQTRVGFDLENAIYTIWGNLGYRVGALQNAEYASISDAQGGYSNDGGESLALNMQTFWGLGLVSPVSIRRDFDIAGGFTITSSFEDVNNDDNTAERPFAERMTRILGRVGLELAAVDTADVGPLSAAMNSRPLADVFAEQLERIGLQIDPMTDGEYLLGPGKPGDTVSTNATEMQAMLARSRTAMDRLQHDVQSVGWRTAWSLPEEETMLRECEHIVFEGRTKSGHVLLPRDVSEVSTVRTKRGPVWVVRSDCTAGHTFGSLRPYNAFYVIDAAFPAGKGREAVLSEGSVFFENAAPQLWYNRQFRVKANDDLLIAYAPGGGVITIVDRAKSVFSWIGENLPNGDLLANAWLSKNRRYVMQLNSDGNFYVHSIATKGKVALSGRIVDDEVAIWTDDYQYDATAEAATLIDLKFPGHIGQFSLDRFGLKRRVPGLGHMVIDRGAPPRLDRDIGVPPSLVGTLELSGDGRIAARFELDSLHVARLSVFQDGVLTDTIDKPSFDNDLSFVRLKDARWISVIASSAEELASLPVSVDLGPPIQRKAVNRVLVVGVNTYEHRDLPSLNYPLRDAGGILDVLTRQQESEPAFSAVEGPKDRRATPDAILAATAQLLKDLVPGDHAVLFLAGHGLRDKAGRFYFATSRSDPADLENTALPFERLAALLSATEARVTVLLDACHSGLAGDGILATNDDLANSLANLQSNITTLAAAKGRQDSQGKRDTGGLFSHAIATVLGQDRNRHDTNRNGRIEASELYRGVKSLVVKESDGQQTPWVINSRLVGEYALF